MFNPPPLALCRWLKITTCCCFNQCCWKNLTSPISFWGCEKIPGPAGWMSHLLLVECPMVTLVLLLNLKLTGSSKKWALSKLPYLGVMPHFHPFSDTPKVSQKNVDVILRYFKYPIFMNDPRFTIPWTCCTGVSHMAMDQYLLIPCLGEWTSSNPSYFDVHQGYKVLTHCHILCRCFLAIDHWDCGGGDWAESQGWGGAASRSERSRGAWEGAWEWPHPRCPGGFTLKTVQDMWRTCRW